MGKIKKKIAKLIVKGIPTTKGALAKRIICYSIFFMSSYAIAGMFLLYKGISLDSTLTQCVFTFFGAELTLLMIKRLLSPKDGQGEDAGIDTNEKV